MVRPSANAPRHKRWSVCKSACLLVSLFQMWRRRHPVLCKNIMVSLAAPLALLEPSGCVKVKEVVSWVQAHKRSAATTITSRQGRGPSWRGQSTGFRAAEITRVQTTVGLACKPVLSSLAALSHQGGTLQGELALELGEVVATPLVLAREQLL